MARIQVLDKTISELIAAGEVVERPASIVKELIENSIDAGATQITIEIKGGGIGYIRITDNGCGIDKEDIPKAFLRHATSKVSTAEDLIAIYTLGFRGEALSSVAAVSKVEITSKTKDSLDGWFYEIQGGVALEIPSPTGATDGTTMIIRDLFYNTPARMKFLRSDVAEGNSVAQVIDRCALSHPGISFHFIRDTKTRLQTSGNGHVLSVISAVYGREFADNMLKVDYLFEKRVRITGYVGKPSASKPSRGYQNFFINGRYVKMKTCGVSLAEAYKGKLMTGRFPVAVLSVKVDAAQVDANVHPAKIEVRFSEEKLIYNAVYFSAKSALSKIEQPISAVASTSPVRNIVPASTYNIDIQVEDHVQEKISTNETIPISPDAKEILHFSSPSASRVANPPLERMFSTRETLISPPDFSKEEDFRKTAEVQPHFSEPVLEEITPKEDVPVEGLRFVGELFHTYIVLENENNDMLLVDKHAAHERLTYEQVKENSLSGNRQVLLAAIPVTLQKEEYSILLQNLPLLEQLGFLMEDFGTGTVIVRESAVALDGKDLSFLLSEVAQKLIENRRDITPDTISRLYYSIACKSSVRGGDRNSKAELMEIIKKLEKNPEITHCPHGRPVSIKISQKEIEKMFGRLG